VGRRSRKRALAERGGSATRSPKQATTRAERDAARRARGSESGGKRARPGRPSIDERPPAPWGNFPLSELVILLGIGLMTWGFLTSGSKGNLRLAAGLVLASLGGLELAVREHVAGFRSHSSLLAGVAALLAVTVLALGPGPHVVWALLIVAVVVFGAAFYGLRELFKRRSGGLGFR
jgi:hypothetical protein